jgi:hypothetical protein
MAPPHALRLVDAVDAARALLEQIRAKGVLWVAATANTATAAGHHFNEIKGRGSVVVQSLERLLAQCVKALAAVRHSHLRRDAEKREGAKPNNATVQL